MPNDGWNFQVERVPLDGLDVDASRRLGMVIVQPEYEHARDGTVPFRISEGCKKTQVDLIGQAFGIRAAESQERGVPVPFILFPEAAIPVVSADGLDVLQRQMQEAQGEMAFIGGLEGLTGEEALGVADRFNAARPAFAAGAFTNLCVIVIKSADGQVHWHFQAKLRASQWEQPRNMARGQRVLYFVAPKVAFLCQICFDHIAQEGEEHLNLTLCRKVIDTTRPNAATLDFLFVPQYNPKPNDQSFRQSTSRVVNLQNGLFHNSMTAIVVVNKAATLQESSDFGRSGFHYAAGRWQVSSTDIGPKGYELYDSDDVTSAVFRKRTPAIHVATLVPPLHNVGDAGNPRHPLETPHSYLTGNRCDSVACTHLPGKQGNVGKYVECDCLPCKLRDWLLRDLPTTDRSRHRWTYADQSTRIESHYAEIRQRLLALNCQRAAELLDLLFLAHTDRHRNPDTWREAVELLTLA